MRVVKFRIFGFIFGALTVYCILFYSFFENYRSINEVSSVNFEYVVVHLDLKGSPPSLIYLTSLLPLFRKLGVNGILMEYEDTFPYHGTITNLSSTKPYHSTELRLFISQANTFQIEIIPLIQTFGHMEHALKLEKYQHLRENFSYPDSICPSNAESLDLIKEMLRQVIQFHTSVIPLKHIHIGCDEVYQLNKCQKCRHRNLSSRDIFIDHVKEVQALVQEFNPRISILMWDDMFRQSNKHKWYKSNIAKLRDMEPVYWDYTPRLARTTAVNLFHYHQTFRNIWISSAFKGADGKLAHVPKQKDRFQNHYSWCNFVLNYVFAGEKEVFNFKGIILTGWSRYSHFDPMCELLPVSIPSLVMNLLVIEKFRQGVTVSDTLLSPDSFFDKYVAKHLTDELICNNSSLNYENISLGIEACKYKGSNLITLLKQYEFLMSSIAIADGNGVISVPEFYSKMRTLNVRNAKIGLEWCKKVLRDIRVWKKAISTILKKYYDRNVVKEYVSFKTYSVRRKLEDTIQRLQNYLKVKLWERRSEISFR